MKDLILQEIVKATRSRVEADKCDYPIDEIQRQIYEGGEFRSFTNREVYSFEKALFRSGIQSNNIYRKDRSQLGPDRHSGDSIKRFSIGFICEVKKASPSRGIISEDFPYLSIAKEYEHAGAAAISVLTEEKFFLGSTRYLEEISKNVQIPVLRKDFIIDEYQIYESKIIGADAILLICALLSLDELKKYINICDTLGMSALVEAHTEDEVDKALTAGARIIGVNNRNLDTFEVDIQNSIRLRSMVPDDVIFVAESGIRSPEDINALARAGVEAVLVGETLMLSKDKGKSLSELRGLNY